MSWTRHTGYQDPANYLGYFTSSKAALADKTEPSNPNNDYCQKKPTLYDAKPVEITRENPLLIHDQYVTTNNYLHGKQDQEVHHKFSHGIYTKAPGLSRISYIRPGHNIKLSCSNESDGYNSKIVPFATTEFRDAYATKRGLLDCGNKKSPSIGYFYRDVGYPQKNTSEFGKSASIGFVCDNVSPQISTTHSVHRKFSNDEVKHFTQAKSNYPDLTLKLSIQPMEDPYERTLSNKNKNRIGLSSPDNRDIREAPPSSTDYSKRKLFFNSSPYKGCHPVPYGPTIPLLGDKSSYQSSYTWPKHIQTKEDFTCGIKALYIQPKESAVVEETIIPLAESHGKLYQCPNVNSENDIGAEELKRSTPQYADTTTTDLKPHSEI